MNDMTIKHAPAIDEKALVTVLENSLYPGAQPTSIALVLNYCKAAGLDPMMKSIHIVPMWDSKAGRMRDTIMPGIGLYRTQAARSGQYAGMSEPEFGPDVTETLGAVEITYPAWCKVTAKRSMPSGAIAEFPAVERWKENYAVKGGKEKSVAPNSMWQRRPYAQLAKCATAQALRAAFPELTGSQPTAEEMEGKEIIDVTPKPITPTTGADEHISEERRKEIKELSVKMLEHLDAGAIDDAVLEGQNADLEADEMTFLWTKFSAPHRRVMKEASKRMREEAETAAIAKIKAICAEVLEMADTDTAYARLDDARFELDALHGAARAAAVMEIEAASATIKERA